MNRDGLITTDRVYTVSQLTEVIKADLESAFPLVWVEGEISNFKRAPSGHLYFTLKDERSQLQAVMWRSDARGLRFDLKDGLKLTCRGRITVYEQRGQYQLVAVHLEPKGKGALQLAFEQLKEKLRAEGLFDPARKKPLPLFPKKLGIVTSPRGAAIVDILRTIDRRFARLHILIYPVRVQGEGAADEIVAGIDFLGRRPDIDVLIVGRGGGSIEDLWAFNEEKVARAIARSPVPVISAVGHEVDFTIADFVADIRASTPSAAAEIVIKEERAHVECLDGFRRRLSQAVLSSLQDRRHRLLGLSRHPGFQGFRMKLLGLEQRIDDLEHRARDIFRKRKVQLAEHRAAARLAEERLTSHLRGRLARLLADWERLSAGLHNLSPLNILQKGYTLCWTDDSRLIRRIEEVEMDKDVTVTFYKGDFTCRVKSIDAGTLLEERLAREKK